MPWMEWLHFEEGRSHACLHTRLSTLKDVCEVFLRPLDETRLLEKKKKKNHDYFQQINMPYKGTLIHATLWRIYISRFLKGYD